MQEDDLTAEENNHILLNRRPYFFKYLYRDSKKDYNEYNEKQDTLSIKLFGKPLDTVLHSLSPNKEEQDFIDHYYEWCPLIISNSCMNMVCKYIESIDFDLKARTKANGNFDRCDLYKKQGIVYDTKQKTLALKALKEYKDLKAREQISKNYIATYVEPKEQFKANALNLEEIASEYISNINILTNIYVDYFYVDCPKSNKDILWKSFGKNIYKNILENTHEPILFPLKDENGDIEYLGEKYSVKEIEIGQDN